MGKDNGGAAFPHSFTADSIGDCSGMTLRDYFAAKAMSSYLTHVACADSEAGVVAGWSYEMADAMLKARNA